MVGIGHRVIEGAYTATWYRCPSCNGSGCVRRDGHAQKYRVCNGFGTVLSCEEPRLSELVEAGETQ